MRACIVLELPKQGNPFIRCINAVTQNYIIGGSYLMTDESKLVPCSLCCGEVFPEMEHGVLITGGEQFYIAQCPKCCTIISAESWNRLHGGTRIEVEGCGGCPLTTLVSWTCSHPKTSMRNKCKQVLLYYFKSFPTWCPLRTKNQGPITIGIKEVE